jgi:hypothetical protein
MILARLWQKFVEITQKFHMDKEKKSKSTKLTWKNKKQLSLKKSWDNN